ncbi:MAG: DnaD domain protein [Acidaminococcus intestini]|jgi:DnaD/phage-associated family protein|nr:DnaD domain protein [Acidaminococcus intestini]MBS5582621.1 DnaD domain protein [Megasphaera sp.]DAP16734.1 MAG TPA: DnaD like replication protein [Caudoviricetes sp.]MCB6424742.1 DnaD domain protein [Acidaminococcus intestini]MCB7082741.1 DnaD domain protein [Acidaminococcus intestini]MCG5012392.1 DnaD domain protein [Acidaminococcus intestini]
MEKRRLKVNYISEINAFHDWLEDHNLSASAILLWYSLMHFCNMTGWRESFNLSMSQIEMATHMKRRTIERARQHLEAAGLIKVTRRGRQSPTYTIYPFIGAGDATIGVCDAQDKPFIGAGDASIGAGDASIGAGDATIGVCDHIPRKIYKTSIDAKATDEIKNVIENYQTKIHPLQSGIEADMLQALIEDYGPELCIKAIDRAVLRRKRTIKYVAGILRRWQQDGYDEADGSVQGEIPEEIKAIPF